ncbi:MAG TPA: thioredoxin domain-containing protein [Kofleriaceae bacterium]|nr:thioredoxin domain-containing protein [Kofleriaceae bacterium]
MRTSLILFAALAACTHDDPPADTTHRIEVLEQQLAAQQAELAQLRGRLAAGPQLEDRVAALEARPVKPAAKAAREKPDPSAIYAVPIAGDPVYGSPSAKVTLVMCGEFACPYCRQAWTTVDQLRAKYGADLRVAYKSFVVHPKYATYMAQAACAANHQGRWRQLADLLWVQAYDTHEFEHAHIDDLAKQAGLDMTRYRADLTGVCPGEVDHEQAELTTFGVNATPTFFINGRYLSGALPIDKFTALIDDELAKASASSTPPEQYYDQEVLARGLRAVAAAPPP